MNHLPTLPDIGRKPPSVRSLPLLLVLLCLAAGPLLGQDFHYSQYYNSPLHLNPALTGIFKGDMRFSGNFRTQWDQVPVDYRTVTLAYDQKFLNLATDKGFFSAGATFNHDRSGVNHLRWTNLDLNGSYTRALSSFACLTIGVQGAIVERSFTEDGLRFDNQFDADRGAYDPSLSNGENFAKDSHVFPDFAVGINVRLQDKQTDYLVDRNDRRSKLDIGLGLHHVFRPNQSFFEGADAPLERRWSPYAFGTLQLQDRIDLVGALTYQNQGPFYDEIVGMLGGRLWLSNSLGNQVSVMAGMGMRRDRIQDAYWPAFEVTVNDLRVGLNYDINVSRFDVATESRGGFELSVRYLIKKVRPLPAFKICPLI